MPKINTFTFNSTVSTTYGIYVTGKNTFDAAELDVTKYEIPGRNGDLIIPNNRYKNITVTYPAFIPKAFTSQVQAIRNWLRSVKTYAKLEDTYDTTHFRMGIPVGIQEFSPVNQNDAANFEVTFDCKPQRFTNAGNLDLILTSSPYSLTNSTKFTALPIFEVKNPTGSATIKVVNDLGTFQLDATTSYTGTVTIDCETQNIYSGSTNLNSLFSGDFPVLASGTNTVTFSGFTTVSAKPRWWEL